MSIEKRRDEAWTYAAAAVVLAATTAGSCAKTKAFAGFRHRIADVRPAVECNEQTVGVCRTSGSDIRHIAMARTYRGAPLEKPVSAKTCV